MTHISLDEVNGRRVKQPEGIEGGSFVVLSMPSPPQTFAHAFVFGYAFSFYHRHHLYLCTYLCLVLDTLFASIVIYDSSALPQVTTSVLGLAQNN
jgi:hypothetical protein